MVTYEVGRWALDVVFEPGLPNQRKDYIKSTILSNADQPARLCHSCQNRSVGLAGWLPLPAGR